MRGAERRMVRANEAIVLRCYRFDGEKRSKDVTQ
jgi:hypothetical protein